MNHCVDVFLEFKSKKWGVVLFVVCVNTSVEEPAMQLKDKPLRRSHVAIGRAALLHNERQEVIAPVDRQLRVRMAAI